MSIYLLADLGSTYTKLTAVDIKLEKIIGTSIAFTTVNTNINDGFNHALNELRQKIGKDVIFSKSIACSSAAGGLKMAASGLVEELTTEAAKRVCLGAGAKVELVFSHNLTTNEVNQILEGSIDIILLAGGTDGGNSKTVIHNAHKIAESNIDVPIIFAGNKDAAEEVENILKTANKEYYICENVMPKLNKLNIEDAKNKIQNIFINKIIHAKGIQLIEKQIDGVIFPTPTAVLKAAELLSLGFAEESGLGDLVLVDIGGATTDIYSMSDGLPKKLNTVVYGLEEPFAKRTVEGDLGMRYSASGVLDALSNSEKAIIKKQFDLENEVALRHENPEFLPVNEHDHLVETFIAKTCASTAFSRHVGTTKDIYTNFGIMSYQTGKDLTDVKYIIGTGGVIINNKNPNEILNSLAATPVHPFELRPIDAKYLLDKQYILSAMGLLSTIEPEVALRIMKKHLL